MECLFRINTIQRIIGLKCLTIILHYFLLLHNDTTTGAGTYEHLGLRRKRPADRKILLKTHLDLRRLCKQINELLFPRKQHDVGRMA